VKILVVGGTGFLGSQLCKILYGAGLNVRSMSREALNSSVVPHFLGDLENPSSFQNWVEEWAPNVIIQTAWVTEQQSHRESKLNSKYALQTLELAKFGFQIGVEHFIALGSSAEYGFQTEACDSGITVPLPLDIYGEKKLETLNSLRVLASEFDRRITWARIFQAYGFGQDGERLIPSAITSLRNKEYFKCKNPESQLDWITSRDVARAILWVIENKLPDVIDVGTSIGTSVREILLKLVEIGDFDQQYLQFEEPPSNVRSGKLVVSSNSSLLASGWQPSDELVFGLKWAIGS
jgi:nucleoside-diphosphate-sugar epimerase